MMMYIEGNCHSCLPSTDCNKYQANPIICFANRKIPSTNTVKFYLVNKNRSPMVKSVPNSQFSSVNPDSSSVRKLLSDCDLSTLHFQILIHKSESILQFYFFPKSPHNENNENNLSCLIQDLFLNLLCASVLPPYQVKTPFNAFPCLYVAASTSHKVSAYLPSIDTRRLDSIMAQSQYSLKYYYM